MAFLRRALGGYSDAVAMLRTTGAISLATRSEPLLFPHLGTTTARIGSIGERTSVGATSSAAVAALRTTSAISLATRSEPLRLRVPALHPHIRSLCTDNKGGRDGDRFWSVVKEIRGEMEQNQNKIWAAIQKFAEDATEHRLRFSFYMNVLAALEFTVGLLLVVFLYPVLTAHWRKEETEKMKNLRRLNFALDEISGRIEKEKKKEEERARMEKMTEEAARSAAVDAAEGGQG